MQFHGLFLDGVFTERADGTLEFHPADPPSDEDVARLLATIRRRVLRLLARRGLAAEDAPDVDPLAEESPALAGISSDVLACPRCGGRMTLIATIEAGRSCARFSATSILLPSRRAPFLLARLL